MKNQMDIMPTRCIVHLPENDLQTTNTNATTPAQKMGRWYSARSPSEGSSVQPITSPFSSDSGLGVVNMLTTTVTVTQMIQAQRARNMFSAIGLATKKGRCSAAPWVPGRPTATC